MKTLKLNKEKFAELLELLGPSVRDSLNDSGTKIIVLSHYWRGERNTVIEVVEDETPQA